MKKSIVVILTLLLSTAAMANSGLPFLSFGLKAGFTSNQQKIDWTVFESTTNFKKNADGFNAGGIMRVDFPLLPIYLQGELLYDFSKYKNFSFSNTSQSANVTTHNFSIPVLVGIGIGSSSFIKLRANAGPVFNLASSVKWGTDKNVNIDNIFRKQSVTWTAGLGLDIFRIMFDVRYNGSFSKKEISNLGDMSNINTRPTSWTFSLGYLF